MFNICPRDGKDSPWPVFERIRRRPEHLELSGLLEDHEVTIAFMFRFSVDGWMKSGRSVLGTCYMPSVQGELGKLFDQLLEDALGYFPDFLIILNGEWWEAATDREREILVAHEIAHAGQARDAFGQPKFNMRTGRPVLALRPHDLEEFNFIVERYGAWKSDVAEFLDAADRHKQRRNEPGPPPTLRPIIVPRKPSAPSAAAQPTASAADDPPQDESNEDVF